MPIRRGPVVMASSAVLLALVIVLLLFVIDFFNRRRSFGARIFGYRHRRRGRGETPNQCGDERDRFYSQDYLPLYFASPRRQLTHNNAVGSDFPCQCSVYQVGLLNSQLEHPGRRFGRDVTGEGNLAQRGHRKMFFGKSWDTLRHRFLFRCRAVIRSASFTQEFRL
jgi:hypothetical protein